MSGEYHEYVGGISRVHRGDIIIHGGGGGGQFIKAFDLY